MDGFVRTYDLRMGKLLKDSLECKFFNSDLLAPINSMDLSEDHRYLLASTLSSTIKLVDLASGEHLADYRGHHKSG